MPKTTTWKGRKFHPEELNEPDMAEGVVKGVDEAGDQPEVDLVDLLEGER